MKIMKTLLLLAIILNLKIPTANAMGAKRPNPANPPATNTPPPKPTIDLGADLDTNEYLNASGIVGSSVDNYKNLSELEKVRSLINQDSIDKCSNNETSDDHFSDQISFFTSLMFKDTSAMVSGIGSLYGVSENDNNYFPTSLIRHSLCNVSKSSLSKTIKNVPSQNVINKANQFVDTVNSLRSEIINGDMKAKAELLTLWSRFFSCLAYTESLSSADSKTSASVALKYSPSGYRKPAGVEFYEDKAQPIESRLNIGTFQFTPNRNGNIGPCIKAWNKLHNQNPSCLIDSKATQADMIKILGSSFQSFNAFCGVHKLIQTFSIQVNTNKSSATHPSNIVNGKLKSYEQRCVSPHFQAGKAYNHFGPFQNSTGSNMDALFSCTLNSQY